MPFQHTRHYLGAALDLVERLNDHKHGRGTTFMAAAIAAGTPWQLAAVFTPIPPTTAYELEIALKGAKRGAQRKNAGSHLCPTCRVAAGLAPLIVPHTYFRSLYTVEAGSDWLAARGYDLTKGTYQP